MAKYNVNLDIANFRKMQELKTPWLRHYQSLAEIFLSRKSDFLHSHSPGEFLQDEIFDNTPQFAAYLMASTFQSMLWPDSSRTFNLKPVRQIKDLPGVEAFFRFVTDETHDVMDNERAGLGIALMEHFLDQGVFGTSGVATFEGRADDDEAPVLYEAWDVKAMCISQNAQGFVDTVYFLIQRTVKQIMEEYDRVSPKVRELFNAGKLEEKIEILKIIEPKEIEKGKRGTAGMAYRSASIDMKHRFNMRESGFPEMPVAVARMFKRIDETQGHSNGMVALPAALSLNALTEAIIVAAEKRLDPPLALLDDGRLGGAKVDTSAGALSILNVTGRLGNEKPLYEIQTVGDMQSAEKLKEQLIQEIMQAFFLDRLLDLNNQVPMTAYETSVRNRIRGDSLGSIFGRQIMEVLSPTIHRTVKILWRRGRFGTVPGGPGGRRLKAWKNITGKAGVIVPPVILEAIEAGLDVYEIEYISPAKRFMRAEKLQGIFTAADAIAALAPILPGVTDNVDPDKLVQDIYEFAGTPRTSLRTRDEVKAFRKEMAERENAQAGVEMAKDITEVQRNSAQAQATRAAKGGK